MQKLLTISLFVLLLLTTACDRRPGEAVDSPLENPAGSLEELEEATTDEPLADAPIPGSEAATTVSGDEGVEPVLEGDAELTESEGVVDESVSAAPNVVQADAAEGADAVTSTAETQESADVGDTDGDVVQESGEMEAGLLGTARLVNPDGAEVGVVNLLESDEGVVVEFGLLASAEVAPGEHGLHVHETGACEPDFEAAGAHLNPEDNEHGLDNPAGPHAGDLPGVEVSEEGEVTYVVTTDRLDTTSLFDEDGSAFILHADPDDQATDPGGNSGERIACGVLEQAANN